MNTNKHTKYTLAGLGLSVGLAVAAATYGVLAMLLACYERNIAAGLLALIPTAAGIALGTALLGREDQKGGEQA